jgi:hypothetical protein
MLHRDKHVTKKLQEMNDAIGAESALTLMRDAKYRAYAIGGACLAFLPCLFIPSLIYVKTCSSEKPLVNEDEKLLKIITKKLKDCKVHRANIIDNNGNLKNEDLLTNMQLQGARETNNIVNMFDHFASKGAKKCYGDIPTQWRELRTISQCRKEAEQQLSQIPESGVLDLTEVRAENPRISH